MNNFKQKKISNAPRRPPLSDKARHNILTAIGVILLVVVMYYMSLKALSFLSGTRLIGFFSDIFGKELTVDERGHTNILLMGVGGEGHEGSDLTDTIIIASVSQKDNSISLLSIPRDLYVESSLGGSRINRLYEKGKLQWNSEEGLDFVKDTVSKILDIPLQYYVKVDFEAFEKTVDAVGGIDIDVEQEINDAEYPRDGTYDFEPFYLAKGPQHLDGKTALKYVRSRKTTSDFDRSKRQQELLLAVKAKIKNEWLFSSKSTIKNLYYSLNDHIETNMSVREMISLAEFGTTWDSNNISMATLNDEPIFRGGFLYTPLRELYGGAFVLLPAGDNFEAVKEYLNLVLYGPHGLSKYPVAILNGTEESGLAGKIRGILYRFGLAINKVGNARMQGIGETSIFTAGEDAVPLAEFIKKLFPSATIINQFPEEYKNDPDFAETRIILELGNDGIQTVDELDIFKNIVLLVPVNTGTSSLTTPTE